MQYIINNLPEAIIWEGLSGTERVAANAKNLLMTQMGEVPYSRYRGFDATLYDMTANEMQEVLMPELDRLLAWEPRARAISASMTVGEDMNMVITAIIDVTE